MFVYFIYMYVYINIYISYIIYIKCHIFKYHTSYASLILSSISMISFYILSKRFFLKGKALSDTRVASITKKKYGFAVHLMIYINQYLMHD